MSKQYQKIMDQVEVTDEMADRILQNISHKSTPSLKTKWIKALAAAACLILFAGLPSVFWTVKNTDLLKPPVLSENFGISELRSKKDLEKLLNFELPDAVFLPFEADNVQYFSFHDTLGEIRYTDENSRLSIRKSRGSQDNSGDYTVYSFSQTAEISNLSVLLKGTDEDQIQLALWEYEGFSYSIKLNPPVSKTEFTKIIQGLS